MRGSASAEALCESCDFFYELHELGGYNVRRGIVTEALCRACIDYYGYNQDFTNPRWFERLLKKVRDIKARMEQAHKDTYIETWKQMKIEEAQGG